MSKRDCILSVVFSVGTLWGIAAGFGVAFHGITLLMRDPLNLVLNAYLILFAGMMVVIECHERCAPVEWFPASDKRKRGVWVLGMIFVASLCVNQWMVTGLLSGAGVSARALTLASKLWFDESEERAKELELTEEEHLQRTNDGFGL